MIFLQNLTAFATDTNEQVKPLYLCLKGFHKVILQLHLYILIKLTTAKLDKE